MDLDKVCGFFENDKFAWDNGARISRAEAGDAVCTLELDAHHFNAGGAVQGGAIFTLADFAFAVAANCGGKLTVSLSNNISFIRQPRGKLLTAHATERTAQGRICFYDVSVTDETDTPVAQMTVTGYRKDIELKF